MVNLVNTAGVVTRSCDYDAFGVEKDPDPLDTNRFRYCGEYLDAETGRYYLRARYYDPLIGRFTQRDTHWNTSNMIYGDNPVQIPVNSKAPNIYAISQSTSRYAYCISNPIFFVDQNGNHIAIQQWVPSLSGLTPWLVGGIATGITSIKTALVSSWCVPVSIGAVSVAAISIGLIIKQSIEYTVEAKQAKEWVNVRIREKTVDKNNLTDNSVYVIVLRDTQEVWYVGITKSFKNRQYAHQYGSDPKYPIELYEMIPVETGMTRSDARALEQALICAYTLEALGNSINSISPAKWSEFSNEFARVGSLLSGTISD